MDNFPYTRIVVVGTTSSGKSTLAENLANKLDLGFVELDAIYWRPNWVGTPDDEFAAKVDGATSGDRWALAGNYSRTRPITWPRAEVVIWLDYSLPVIFWQLTKRTLQRTFSREVLWGTNVERLWSHLKLWSDESLFKWLFKTYWRRKREYPALFALPEHQHLEMIRFTSPQETQDWLEGLKIAS